MFADTPIMTLERTGAMRIVLCITLLPLALFSGFGAYSALTAKPLEVIPVAATVALTLAFAGLFVWLFRREATRSTRLFANGIERLQGGESQEMLWSDVTEVWFQAIKVQAGGLIGFAVMAAVEKARAKKNAPLDAKGTNIVVKLVGRAGDKLKVTSNDQGVMAAFEEILRRVNPRLVEDSLRRVQSGETVKFGNIAVSLRGIAAGNKEPVPQQEIEKFAIEGGKLILKKKGAWLTTIGAPIQKIPNVFVLTELYARLFTGARDVPPAAPGRNLAQRMFV